MRAWLADNLLRVVQRSLLGFPIRKSFRTFSTGAQTARDYVLKIQVVSRKGNGGGGGTRTGAGFWPETNEVNRKWKMRNAAVT